MQSAIDAITRDCQPFLSLLKAGCGPLYRGLGGGEEGEFGLGKKVRRDRMPRNMPWILHERADRWFSECFGVRHRGAGLFCTGNFDQARGFGRVAMVFPVEGFQFCWSPQVGDLGVWSTEQRLIERQPGQEAVALCTPDAFARRLDGLCSPYQDWDLGAAVKAGVEVMVACRAYHWVVVQDVEAGAKLLGELVNAIS